MKRVSVWLALVLICGLLATSLVGCEQKEEDGQLTKVRYCEVVRSIFYAPMYVAINEGFFAEEGLELELTTGQGADKVMTALLSGGADIGLAGPEATVYVLNQGQEDYVVNFAQLTNRDGSFLVGREPEPDFKWENLRGKTVIGGRPGGVPQMVLEHVLRKHGLTPGKDVEIITMYIMDIVSVTGEITRQLITIIIKVSTIIHFSQVLVANKRSKTAIIPIITAQNTNQLTIKEMVKFSLALPARKVAMVPRAMRITTPIITFMAR
jgi:ABC-type nitrate/sulfonate/bicarbonate transport system substrate-binding protein